MALPLCRRRTGHLKEQDIVLEEYYGALPTTNLLAIPEEYHSYLSKEDYELMLKDTEAYEQWLEEQAKLPSPTPEPEFTPTPTPDTEPWEEDPVLPTPDLLPEEEEPITSAPEHPEENDDPMAPWRDPEDEVAFPFFSMFR